MSQGTAAEAVGVVAVCAVMAALEAVAAFLDG
jgi:hypothetical protein